MKLLFAVTVRGLGLGGHTRSMLEYVKAMQNLAEIRLLVFSSEYPLVYKEVNDLLILVDSQFILSALLSSYKIIKDYDPDIIHCFDINSYCHVKFTAFALSKSLVLTKCGGPPAKYYFPSAANLTLFSREDADFILNNHFFQKSRLRVFANRVSLKHISSEDNEIFAFLQAVNQGNKFDFLQICRIGKSYKQSIIKLITLANLLNKLNIKAVFCILGVVEDQQVFDYLNSIKPSNVRFVTDRRYTFNASQYTKAANYIIGTGRGIAESALKGQIVLAFTSNLEIPILVTSSNYDTLQYANFSMRSFASATVQEEIVSIVSLLNKRRSITSLVEFDPNCLSLFEQDYSSSELSPKLCEFYSSLNPESLNAMNTACGLFLSYSWRVLPSIKTMKGFVGF